MELPKLAFIWLMLEAWGVCGKVWAILSNTQDTPGSQLRNHSLWCLGKHVHGTGPQTKGLIQIMHLNPCTVSPDP